MRRKRERYIGRNSMGIIFIKFERNREGDREIEGKGESKTRKKIKEGRRAGGYTQKQHGVK